MSRSPFLCDSMKCLTVFSNHLTGHKNPTALVLLKACTVGLGHEETLTTKKKIGEHAHLYHPRNDRYLDRATQILRMHLGVNVQLTLLQTTPTIPWSQDEQAPSPPQNSHTVRCLSYHKSSQAQKPKIPLLTSMRRYVHPQRPPLKVFGSSSSRARTPHMGLLDRLGALPKPPETRSMRKLES